ncbi:hypothetical protein GCG54_00006287 [Colletotrichum gloeosporioides]|uniref:Uncharacterized protein n=1 Tax=Colletotrichum gloeosporioides TaxID=474922 RepID=A0A8H4FPH8_COLGL|nr:uncharacterized protein GCG54_00006287 [Colletotrichum gloeosporioides]KAF3808429.1 hypothetical protein GCG54_00006287 [Colletotrichum gloeosporioides]
MFIFPILPLLVVGLSTTALGDKHRLCACTNTEGNAIDDTLTSTATDNKGSFVISLKVWTADEGAPLAGKYAHTIDGCFLGSRSCDDSFIGGDEMNGLCGGHSTYFTPTKGDYTF